MARAKEKGTKSGKAIGRPRIDPQRRKAIRETYQAGGIGAAQKWFYQKFIDVTIRRADTNCELQYLPQAGGRSWRSSLQKYGQELLRSSSPGGTLASSAAWATMIAMKSKLS